MKIKHKISGSMLIIILGFLFSTLFLQVQQNRIENLHAIKSLSTSTLSEWNRLTSVTKGFLVSQRPVPVLYDEYTLAFNDFRASINALKEYQEDASLLRKEVNDRIEALIGLWDMYEVNFEIIADTTRGIAESHLADDIGIQGVLSFFIRSIRNDKLSNEDYQLLQTIDSNISSIESAAAEFQDGIYVLNETLDVKVSKMVQQSKLFSILISVVLILFAVLFASILSMRISKRVEHVEGTMHKVAQRDITVRYDGTARDEIGSLGRDLNSVLDSMQEFFATSNSVSENLEDLKDDLSDKSTDSVAAMEEISHHLRAIASHFQQLDKRIQSAEADSQKIVDVVNAAQSSIEDHGNPLNSISTALEQMHNAISEVGELTDRFSSSTDQLLERTQMGNENVAHTQRLISKAAQEVEKLVHVNEVIEGITEQTHLLSINASIESANAGEAGVSFGVIAGEIKKLAATTAEHSHKIEEALQTITILMREAEDQGDRSADSFQAIQSQVNQNTRLFSHLHSKTEELRQNGNDIVQSNSHIYDLTEQLKQEYRMIQKLSKDIKSAMQTATSSSGDGIEQIDSIKNTVERVETALHRMANAIDMSHEKTAELTGLLKSFKT